MKRHQKYFSSTKLEEKMWNDTKNTFQAKNEEESTNWR